MKKSPNLITGYHIPSRLVDRNGRNFPNSHKIHNLNIRVNSIKRLNGHRIDLEDNNK